MFLVNLFSGQVIQGESKMKKQISVFLALMVGFSFAGAACQSKQTVSISSNKNQAETRVKENPSPTVSSKNNLNVSIEFWKQQLDKALEKRDQPTGDRPPGIDIPMELVSNGVVKQTAKLAEMAAGGYVLPLDFPDLAEKRAKGELVELPMATETYFLDGGGNATETEFSSFSFEDGAKPLKPDSPKFAVLKKLADDFDGEKFDLNNPKDRKQMRIRLLRMINPQVQKILEEIADSYQKKFSRPLRITGMTRSMDYQISLNAVDATTFKVRDKDSRPPHLSGCAFDIARKHLTAEEQNFIMQKLSEMEINGKVDALNEFGANACFHVFVYQDGKPPKMENN